MPTTNAAEDFSPRLPDVDLHLACCHEVCHLVPTAAHLADASLLWLAHHRHIRAIATLDRRDFSVYRLPGGDALHNVMEAIP